MMAQFSPDYNIHPGEYIEEILEVQDMKRNDFAERCGISAKAVSQIINGKSLFSSDLAVLFERVLGIEADLLMNLVTSFQMFESREKERKSFEKKKDWLKKFPEKELMKNKIIPKSEDIAERTENLLDFFGISDPESLNEYYSKKAVSFRQSPTFESSLEATVSWLRIGERLASQLECQLFDKEKFKLALLEIRKLSTGNVESFSQKMVKLCSECGVALVFVPALKDVHISGITEWLSSDKALIIMSLRHKTNDHFWFTFFHEAAHILLHGKKEVFIEAKDDSYSEKEEEANTFSRKILIDLELYKSFILKNYFDKKDIVEFAKSQKIHPGIVVGMLQHDKLIKYQWHNDLKTKLEFNEQQ